MDDMDPKSYAYPVDGLIIEQNDVAYGKSLGHTGHHENRMIALKWKDEEYETRFRGVELRPTRKGRLSLTGIFDPVEMDGATVSRATLHNFDMFKRFRLGLGDRVLLIRSNMVIPQLVKNLDCSDTYELPETCPCCGADVVIRKEENTNFLYCSNPRCPRRFSPEVRALLRKDEDEHTGAIGSNARKIRRQRVADHIRRFVRVGSV